MKYRLASVYISNSSKKKEEVGGVYYCDYIYADHIYIVQQ